MKCHFIVIPVYGHPCLDYTIKTKVFIMNLRRVRIYSCVIDPDLCSHISYNFQDMERVSNPVIGNTIKDKTLLKSNFVKLHSRCYSFCI
jgi:hypothetical protein